MFFVTNLQAVTSQTLNVDCGPHPHYVIVDKNYRYNTYMVEVQRCFGKNYFRKTMKCVPKTSDNYTFDAFENAAVSKVSVTRHTKCHEVCTINATHCNENEKFNGKNCACDCQYNKDPGFCSTPFYWDKTLCNCKCPYNAATYKCPDKKTFDTLNCGCTCEAKHFRRCSKQKRYVYTNTCACTDVKPGISGKATDDCSNGISNTVVILVIVIEAIAFIAVYYLVNKYFCLNRNKKKIKFSEKGYDHHSADKSVNQDSPTIEQSEGEHYFQVSSTEDLITEIDKNNVREPTQNSITNIDEGFYESPSTFNVSDNYATVTKV